MKSIYLIYLVFFLLSCKQEKERLFEFDPRILTENKFVLSEIADEVTYIPLDNSFPIGQIYKKIKFINNSIYLSAKGNGILAFDREGKFVRKIGSIGRGPGEYAYYYDITVDDKKETIYNMDQSNIKVYSKTGDFLRSIRLKEYGDNIDSFEIYNSKLFIFFLLQVDNAKYEWIILDTLGNLIKTKERSSLPFSSNWLISGETYKFENKMSYWNHFNDTVISILPDLSYKASFIINPGEHRMPRSKFSFEQHDKFLHIKQIFETRRFLVIRYHYIKPALVLIDKDNNESFLSWLEGDDSGSIAWYSTGGIVNDLDGGLRFLPAGYFVEKDREYMFGLINPYQIKTHVTSNEFKNSVPKYPEKKRELEKLANSLKETDNPILMLIRLKK